MKSTDNTVFVRFSPPSSDIKRWHLEEYFSQVGPIKKCSVIFGKEHGGLGYGFVKFVTTEDAQEAAKLHNNKTLQVDGQPYQLKVELASKSGGPNKNVVPKKQEEPQKRDTKEEAVAVTPPATPAPPEKQQQQQQQHQPSGEDSSEADRTARRKRTCRVIVRNLSFYATEQDIKKVLQREFGPICDIHIPRVDQKTHRGFCFVTFEDILSARKATEARSTQLLIKKRPVAIDFALSKTAHQRTNHEEEGEEESEEEMEEANDEEVLEENDEEMEEEKEDGRDNDDENSESDESSSDSDQEEERDDDDGNGAEKDETGPTKKVAPEFDEAISEQKTIFIRNLPFDTTRHDIFETMRRFGHIESIHPVTDRETGVFKGTAFLEYRTSEQAHKALAASGTSSFKAQRDTATATGSGELQLRGRRLLLDLAVDKQTATTLTIEKKQDGAGSGKDKRCLYLKDEGYIAKAGPDVSPTATSWESLPESDQLKRYRALADKTTKLKSPLFFINPKRLSIRNLAKHVEETELKKLCVAATIAGLNRVKDDDLLAFWRAQGNMTTREIVARITEAKEKGESILPEFDERNVKKYIPSVFIDRDFAGGKVAKTAPSRGFGFVDFTHHTHALACLRELNNNPKYSAEFVTGGRKAAEAKKKRKKTKDAVMASEFVSEDGRHLVPRLIVEFTVENKVKAQQQASNRVKQQANVEKQRMEQEERKNAEKKKKSRGKLQREKKRKQREEGAEKKDEPKQEQPQEEEVVEPNEKTPKRKAVKPMKKHKVDKEEQSFANLVQCYTEKFTTAKGDDEQQGRTRVKEKRWFE